jgi:uncharacterized protein (TIGR02421 family)
VKKRVLKKKRLVKKRRKAVSADSIDHPLGIDLADVTKRLRSGEQVRRTLRPWGRLHIDRALPFLCVYRRPPGSTDRRTEALITTQASYLLAPGGASSAGDVVRLVRALVGCLVDDFGACLLIEICLAKENGAAPSEEGAQFRIVTRKDGEPSATVSHLESELSCIDPTGRGDEDIGVAIERRSMPAPPGLPPLMGSGKRIRECFNIGLEISPIYSAGEKEFPLVHRRLRSGLSGALKQAAFEFTTRHTIQRPMHYHALGRAKFVKAVWEADRRLAEVSNRFDFLLLSTPRNSEEAWAEFRRSHFSRAPSFSYPPLPFEPSITKRELYAIPLERIEDPTLEDLFLEQQDELDRKITMLATRGTPRFLYGSLQLFGPVDDKLLGLAKELLERIPPRSRETSKGGVLDASAFAARAEEELEHLRDGSKGLPARVRIRRDISGLMVSRGHLLVPAKARIPAARVVALLQHEVGTHILTYYNGGAQPFRQLRNGLPGYEELQEGLAVLAEYLVGGLGRARLRILAARVLAVRRMTDGASFVEVFRELDRDYDFSQHSAYTIAMRVFRGGGQAKDAVYLRGLASLLEYLGGGGDLEPLLVGKIGLQHLEVVNELRWREVLVPPPFRPRYLELPEASARLERLRRGAHVMDLAKPEKRRPR